MLQSSSQTLPPSRNTTPPRLPSRIARSSEVKRQHRVAADRRAFAAERAHLVAAPAADARGAAEEKLLRERHVAGIVGLRVDVADLQAVGDHQAFAHRQEVPRIEGQRREVERARQEATRRLRRGKPSWYPRRASSRLLVVEWLKSNAIDVSVPSWRPVVGSSPSAIRSSTSVGSLSASSEMVLLVVLAAERHGPRRAGIGPVGQRRASSRHQRFVGRRHRAPVLAVEARREVRREHVRLVEDWRARRDRATTIGPARRPSAPRRGSSRAGNRPARAPLSSVPYPTPKLTRWWRPSTTVTRVRTSGSCFSGSSASMLTNWNSSMP